MKVLLLTLLVSLGSAAAGCGGDRETAAGERGCGEIVLDDWSDGRLDGIYASNCYLAAIELLPEDVRTYTTAADDLSRALQSRRTGEGPRDPGRRTLAASDAATADGTEGLREVPAALLLLGGVAALVAVGGGVAFGLRRAGGRR